MSAEIVGLRRPGGAGALARKALAILTLSLRRRLGLLGETLVRVSFLAVMLYIFTQLWSTISATLEATPGGYSVAQLVWYLTFAEALILSTPSNWGLEVDREVRSGDLAYRLVRPLPYPLYHLAYSTGDRLLRFAACLGLGSGLAWLLVGPPPVTPAGVAAAGIAAALGLVVDELATLALSLCSFWVENTTGLHLLYRRGVLVLGGGFIPLEAYPDWLAAVCRSLPFQLLAAGPARLFVGAPNTGAGAILLAQLGFGLGALAALVGLYRLGLRRLTAQGG